MSTHKHIDKICCVVLVFTLLLSALFMCSGALGVETKAHALGYEERLFDTSRVHTVDIVMNDWESFIESCTNEEYSACSVVIDGEAYKNIAIRAKGNTSLSQVQSSDSDRYSFKIEFDHYDSTKSYHGLDKLCLNNIIQDNTYMKDYLTYQMMNEFGVASPLCSFVYITVNGEDWGLYLAVEAVEESFLMRNYGTNYGELYKPDSISMGGGRGNGKDFDMEDWEGFEDIFGSSDMQDIFGGMSGEITMPDMGDMTLPDMSSDTFPSMDGTSFPDMSGDMTLPEGMENMMGNMGGMSMGSDDVTLIYSDDDPDSYSNIFGNAKTDITDADMSRLIASLKAMNEQTNIEGSVNAEDVIRYFVVHNFVVNFDSYTGSMIHNYYLYEEDGRLSMIPWDYNLAFGGFQSSSDASSLVNYPIDSPVSGGTVDSRPMLAWIFASEEYTEIYHDLFSEFISEYFESGYFAEMIDSVKAMIAPYIEKDPTKFCTYDEFLTGIDTLKEFCLLRAESVRGQLDGTIGSTSEAQKDKANFVSTDGLSISAMGSMSVGMGGGNMFGGREDGEMTARPDGNTRGESDVQIPSESMPSETEPVPGVPSDNNENAPSDSGVGQLPEMNGGIGGNIGMQDENTDGEGSENSGMRPGMNFGGMQGENAGGMQIPGNIQGGQSSGSGSLGSADVGISLSDDAILLIVSVAVLAAGILFAGLFKRRK